MIRGKLISLNTIEKKNRTKDQDQLQKELEKIEKELKKRQGKKTLEKQRKLLRQQISNLEKQEMIWALRRTQQKLFEGANKLGIYLAYQFKKKGERRIISKITADGKEIVDNIGIKNAFLKFYSNLYRENTINHPKLQKYINENEIPKLTVEDKNLVEELITTEEVEEATMQMKTGKAPETDGFTAKFYKTFKTELSYKL